MELPANILSRFSIQRLLGEGSLGKVYQGEEQGKLVAVKVLRADLPEKTREFFKEEARVLSQLSHPNLVKIEDFYAGDPGRPASAYFVMELLEGDTLDRLPKDTPMAVWEDIFLQCCQGLDYLHHRNILHHDLKPSNIFLTSSGKVKILDFSLATSAGGDAKTPAIRGTLPYLPPEIFLGIYEERSDLYSLGVVFYQLLCGRFPYTKVLRPETLPQLPPPPSPRSLRPEVPEYFESLLMKLLQLDPGKRPGSISTVLRYFQNHHGGETSLQGDSTDLPIEKLPLIGRDAELARFRELLPKAHPCLLLSGPTGVGRSRFLEELRWERLLKGQGFLVQGPPHINGWIRMEGEEAGDAYSRAEAFLQVRKGREGILLFSDLHQWQAGDLADLEIFLKVLTRGKHPLSILLEFNSDLLSRERIFPASPEFLASAPEIHLGDLEASSIKKMLQEASVGHSPSSEVLQGISVSSGGRPLLALESLKAFLLQRPREGEPEKVWEIPKSLEEVAHRRYLALDKECRRALALLVLAPREVERQELEAVWGENRSGLSRALSALDRQEWLQARNPEKRTIQLRYPSLKAGFQAFLEPVLRQEALTAWAKYFEDKWRANPLPEDLFCLLDCAIAGDFTELLKAYAFTAIPFLDQRGQSQRAIALTDKLLALPETEVDQVLLFAHRANLYFHLDRFEESLESYRRWFKVRVDDESKLQLTKFLFYSGLVQFSAGHSVASREDLEKCIKAGNPRKYPALVPYHARALLLLVRLALKERDYPRAHSDLARAAELPLEDPELLGEIQQVTGETCYREMRYGQALEHLNACQIHYDKTGIPQLQALGHGAKAMVLHEMDALEEALRELESALSLLAGAQYRSQRARYLGNQALLLSELGRYAEARKDIDHSLEVLQVLGNPAQRWIAKLQWAQVQMDCGNAQNLSKAFSEFLEAGKELELLELTPSLWQLRAEAALLYGDWASAEGIFRDLLSARQVCTGFPRFLAAWGLLRAELIQGKPFEPKPEIVAAIEASHETRQGGAVRAFIQFIQTKPEDLGSAEVQTLFSQISAIESVHWRLNLLFLSKIYFSRLGVEVVSEQVFQYEQSLWPALEAGQPEEIKMDLEKKRGLFELNEELKKPLRPEPAAETAEPAVPARPVATSAPKGLATNISEERFRQFCEITNRIARKESLTEILEIIMDSALALTGAERGFLILENPQSKDGKFPGFEVAMARHLSQKALGEEEFKFSLSLVKKAIQSGSPVLSNDALADDEFENLQSVHLFQLRSVLVVPLEVSGHILGVLYLDHRMKPNCFGSEDLLLISGFAGQAGLAIQRAQMLEQLKKSHHELEARVEEQTRTIESLHEEVKEARSHLKYEYKDIVGGSPAIMQVFKMMEHVTKTKIPVWIWGESGTGKELFARSLHFNSPWKDGPFVSENCGSIPENLLESELFGHKKGAFTHADRDRIGLFEQANGGTLFLDEVADMALPMQVKLLRVLQEGELRPVGSNKKIKIDVRLVTASNRDLAQLVREGKFREDLFYRINGMTLRLPPLRERREDIPSMVQYMIEKIAKNFFLKPCKISKDAYHMLMTQDWPGNVRQLEGVVRNAMMFADGGTITSEILKMTELALPSATAPAAQSGFAVAAPSGGGRRKLDESASERAQLIEALRRHSMDKNKVAEELGITLKSVYVRMERHGIPKKNSLLMRFLTEN
ncbi:MAG: sigma 54-interacting transcriptional regulator [bacterium]